MPVSTKAKLAERKKKGQGRERERRREGWESKNKNLKVPCFRVTNKSYLFSYQSTTYYQIHLKNININVLLIRILISSDTPITFRSLNREPFVLKY